MTKWKRIKRYARGLRKNQTASEKILWSHLRGKQLGGHKFLRQHPIVYDQKQDQRHFFIADFYCYEKELVIELDGKIHDLQKKYDYNRDLVINKLGLNVLRIKNKELDRINLVKQKILTHLQ
jgi:leucyl-tRNA synthetase